jgi:hypothetical protein
MNWWIVISIIEFIIIFLVFGKIQALENEGDIVWVKKP